MTPLYDHAYTIAFSLISSDAGGADVSSSTIRDAVLRRLAALSDDELLEAIGAPFDSYEITGIDEIPEPSDQQQQGVPT